LVGVGRAFIDLVTARHQPIADRAVQLVRRCEAEFAFKSGVKRVVVFGDQPTGRYVPRNLPIVGETIVVYAAPVRSRALREYVFHEMGHAVREGFDVEPWLAGFCRRRREDHVSYEEASDAAALRPRPVGYVSGYATCDRDEDFCETLSAYLCNRRTWRTEVRFGSERVPVRGDVKLRRKLDAIHELLGELHRFR